MVHIDIWRTIDKKPGLDGVYKRVFSKISKNSYILEKYIDTIDTHIIII